MKKRPRWASGAPSRPDRKRYRPTRVPRKVPLPMTLSVKKKFYLENWAPNTATTAGFWRYFVFQIGQLPDIATYVALFDTYQINGIKVEFHPRFTEFAGNDTTDTVLPGVTNQQGTRMSLLPDPKSNLAPSGAYGSGQYNDFLQQGDPRTYEGTRPFSIYIPKPQVGETVGASIVGGVRRRAPILQLANGQNIDHAGFHAFAWDNNFSGSFGQSFDVLVTYYVTFRGMR